MSNSAIEHMQERTTPHLETTPLHIKGILAATDLSEQATLALKFAARIAKQLHSRLHVLYAVAPQLYVADTAVLTHELQKIEVDRAQEELHEYASRIPEVRTTRHEEIALCGPATETIFQIAEMKGIDLLVMGSHGRGGVAKMVLGSVAEDAIRRVHCPVLVVGPRYARRFGSLKSIVLATDLPVGSWRAAQYATSLARKTGATLTLVHVVSHRVLKEKENGVIVGEQTERELRQLVPHDTELRKHVHFEVIRGNPAEEIVRVATAHKAGLIVMGAREHSIMADHAPWATLSHVIREAHCPVLAVQPHIA